MIFGGPRLLYALQKSSGFMSKAVYDRMPKHRFITCYDDTLPVEILRENMANFVSPRPVERRVQVGMFDETNMVERLVVSPFDNFIRGFAWQSDFSGVNLHLSSYQVLPLIEEAMNAGKLKMAEELLIFAIGPVSMQNYSISLLAGIGTKKKGSAAIDYENIFATIEAEWASLYEEDRGPLAYWAHDGASIFNQAIFQHMTLHEISSISVVGTHLFGTGTGTTPPLFSRLAAPDLPTYPIGVASRYLDSPVCRVSLSRTPPHTPAIPW